MKEELFGKLLHLAGSGKCWRSKVIVTKRIMKIIMYGQFFAIN